MAEKRLLTPEDKDKLLNFLVESCVIEEHYGAFTDSTQITEGTGFTAQEIHALFAQFDLHGLITYHTPIHYAHKTVSFTVHQKAVDFKLNGGYTFEDTILKAQLEKLLLEIKDLEKTHSWEKLATMGTIVSNIITSIAAFKPS